MATAVVHTLKFSGGDYSLMSTWEADEQRDLVALDETETLECYGDWPAGLSNEVGIAGWSADATRFITIKAAPGNEANGVSIDDGGTGFMMSGSASGTMNVAVPYTIVQDIELQATGNVILNYGTSTTDGANSLFQRLVLRNKSYSTGSTSIAVRPPADSVLRNCSILVGGRGIDVRNPSNVSIESCTVIADDPNSAYGVLLDSLVDIKNTAVYGFLTEDVYGTPRTELNCATGDGSLSGPGSISGVAPADFKDYAADDFAAAVGGKLDGTGADLSVEFDTDIAGDTRTVPWTIGAWIVSGAPPVGIQEMYIKDGGIFVKYTPHVKVGGTFQEVDAYVLESGVWVQVYEK